MIDHPRRWRVPLSVAAFALLAGACAPSSQDTGAAAASDDDATDAAATSDDADAAADDVSQDDDAPDADDADVAGDPDTDLDALIAAAQAEGELVVYNTSSAIDDACASFEELYGITCTGFKLDNPEQAERVTREVDSGNVEASVVQMADGPAIAAELVPQGYLVNWVPAWMEDAIPAGYHDPLTWRLAAIIVGYNTQAYPDGCPVDNVWQLTEEEWQGRFGLRDPLTTPRQTDWFQMLMDEPDAMAAAYEAHYGEPLQTDEENAGFEFVRRLAENQPIVLGSDGDVGDAVGAPDQDDPPIGLYYLGKHRDNEEGLVLGLCEGLEPFEGYDETTHASLVADAPHPNAGKLFIHHLLTEEGIAAWTGPRIGDRSTNPDVPPNPEDPYPTLEEFAERTMSVADIDNDRAIQGRQDVQDFWRSHLAN
jgi:iron(III) transport system substrate-binding protein